MSPTQNPNVTSFMAPSLPRTGFSALVIGCRSGSEVFGLARFGVRVVALEKDPEQFRALALRLLAAGLRCGQCADAGGEDEKMGALLRTLHAGTRPMRDRRGLFVQTEEEDAEDEPAASSSSSSSAAPAAERKCVACGQALGLTLEAMCVKDDCPFGAVHLGCCARCPSCRKVFCSAVHMAGHTCVPLS